MPPKKQVPARRASGTTQDAPTEAPKRRGRPPLSASAKAPAPTPTAPVKAARGRPKQTTSTNTAPVEPPKATKRKRQAEEESVDNAPKKRGRPAKVAPQPTRKPLSKKVDEEEPISKVKSVNKKAEPKKPDTTKTTKAAIKAAPKTTTKAATKAGAKPTSKVEETTGIAKRGRPAGSKNVKPKVAPVKATKDKTPKKISKTSIMAPAFVESEAESVEGLTQSDHQDTSDAQYWLMKAEPDTRIEKGIDVAYPIDKLATATDPEPWDGVRNAAARNNMRAMRRGDLAFFYHSNCAVPGIVGVMRIAEEHAIDQSAFDPTHPYYDEKSSRDKPKWDCVKVEFVKKFQNPITLKELKSTPELAKMQVAQKAYGRLSVQVVTPDQWQFVLKMANEPEDLGVSSAVSGYEADTNGETDKDVVEDSIGAGDEDLDLDDDDIAAYGKPGDPVEDEDDDMDFEKQPDGVQVSSVNGEVQAEKDRVDAIDAYAKDITSVGDV